VSLGHLLTFLFIGKSKKMLWREKGTTIKRKVICLSVEWSV